MLSNLAGYDVTQVLQQSFILECS